MLESHNHHFLEGAQDHVNVSFWLLPTKIYFEHVGIFLKEEIAGVRFRIALKATRCHITRFNSLFADPFKGGDPHFNVLSDVGKPGNLVSSLAAIT